ncbi:Hypothetical protein P9303_20781 [Prochlorococcus marinus str. MIT 9303]|uniref:Coenzyme Q (Ubiquinone) biosynthesis protein Coq4 n=2 Tax=Prochlorococcus marinus TaxID=1219 RepID=A2CBF4_PROM3|nr:Hypothetical protein P9303_20781 [Prochlorococcus marinus str. MIT 9303]
MFASSKMLENWNSRELDLTGFFHYMEQPGTATDNASISKIFTQIGVNDQMLKNVLNNPDTKALVCSRYQPKPVQLDDLLKLPEISFGHQWAVFMKKNRLNPNFFINDGGNDDRTYLINRLHNTHDIWHVLLNFDTSEAGEAGMNAFTYAQCYSPTTCMLMAAKLVRAISAPEETRQRMMNNIATGYKLGQELQAFIAVKWEENWQMPLRELRREVGITNEYI